MRNLHLLAASAVLLTCSCQSMSQGILSIEARAIVLEDTDIDSSDPGSSFDEEDIDVSGYGLHAALGTPIVDVLAGVDRREYEDEETDELSIGARRRFLEIWRLHPYIEGNLRYALDLDNGVEEDDYFGWNAGLGALIRLTGRFHINLRLMYETLDVDLPTGSANAEGIIGTAGLVFSF